jgi:hypothetical protein
MLTEKEYYHPLTHTNQFTWVLKEGAEKEKNYYVASRELWMFLHEIYGGEEAIRYRVNLYTGSDRRLDIKFYKVFLSSYI